MSSEADKAERLQAWKAFLIPSGLFVACLCNAAGLYIVYSGNAAGVVFLAIGFAVIATGLFMFITFQNKQRAKGQWKRVNEPESYAPPSSIRKPRPVELAVQEEAAETSTAGQI